MNPTCQESDEIWLRCSPHYHDGFRLKCFTRPPNAQTDPNRSDRPPPHPHPSPLTPTLSSTPPPSPRPQTLRPTPHPHPQLRDPCQLSTCLGSLPSTFLKDSLPPICAPSPGGITLRVMLTPEAVADVWRH